MNIIEQYGTYDEENLGVITEPFLDEVTKTEEVYIIISGKFNLPNQGMTLSRVLNYMYKCKYEFVRFVYIDDGHMPINGIILFKSFKTL